MDAHSNKHRVHVPAQNRNTEAVRLKMFGLYNGPNIKNRAEIVFVICAETVFALNP